jgi:hypothetical protein
MFISPISSPVPSTAMNQAQPVYPIRELYRCSTKGEVMTGWYFLERIDDTPPHSIRPFIFTIKRLKTPLQIHSSALQHSHCRRQVFSFDTSPAYIPLKLFRVDQLAIIFPSSNGLLPDKFFKLSRPSCGPGLLTASKYTLPALHGYLLLSESITSSSISTSTPGILYWRGTGVPV